EARPEQPVVLERRGQQRVTVLPQVLDDIAKVHVGAKQAHLGVFEAGIHCRKTIALTAAADGFQLPQPAFLQVLQLETRLVDDVVDRRQARLETDGQGPNTYPS